MKKNSRSSTIKTTNLLDPQSKGEVRIIAGRWRGRKLPVLSKQGLRPTGDRVKEMLFNWLQADIVDSVCLDAFAGSGSLGFEALSRQAKQVYFVELDKAVAQQLKTNLQQLQKTNERIDAQIFNQNTLTFLNHNPNAIQFDLVFLDPPFHFDLAEQAIALLVQHNWLKNNGLVYVETEKDKQLNLPENWIELKQKKTGQVVSRLYQIA